MAQYCEVSYPEKELDNHKADIEWMINHSTFKYDRPIFPPGTEFVPQYQQTEGKDVSTTEENYIDWIVMESQMRWSYDSEY